MRQKKAKNKKEKPAHTTQNGQTGNRCKSLRKSGNQTRRPGNDAAECGQRKAAEGRHDCGKPHAQPPGGGTSLHPGAASQTRQQKPRTHKLMAGKRQAAAAQTRRRSSRPGPRQRHTGRKNAGAPGAKAATTAAGFEKAAAPGKRRGTPGAEKPLRTGKIRVRSFACPEGPCEPGPPKNRFAVFGWHGLFLLRNARSAEQKGAPPPFIPRSLLKKAGENFHVGPILAGLAISPQVKYHKRDFFRIGRGNGTWAGMQ